MSFESDIDRFVVKLEGRAQTMVPEIGLAVHESIQTGSPITGAPGQPVDTGNLRASWQFRLVSPEVAEITTNVEYAPAIEAGIGPHGPMTVRSEVGGFHSVAMTVANFDRLVDHVLNRDTRPEGFTQNYVGAPADGGG